MQKILFNNNGVSPGIRLTREIKDALTSIFTNEHVEFNSISYIFCKDDYLLALNQEYLNHDTYTDILTFNLSNSPTIIAEIYISIERVKENAAALKISYERELFRVMIHGILHLCGYSDHTPSKKKLMRKKEDQYLTLQGFT